AASVLSPKSVAGAAGIAAGILGMPLAGYTGVLLASSAVPAWQGARGALPVLFVASAMTSAALLLDPMDLSRRERAVVRRFGHIGSVAEFASIVAVQKELDATPQAGRTLKRSAAGSFWTVGRALGAAGLATSILGGRSRWARRV